MSAKDTVKSWIDYSPGSKPPYDEIRVLIEDSEKIEKISHVVKSDNEMYSGSVINDIEFILEGGNPS